MSNYSVEGCENILLRCTSPSSTNYVRAANEVEVLRNHYGEENISGVNLHEYHGEHDKRRVLTRE